jgi:hypothetical protein
MSGAAGEDIDGDDAEEVGCSVAGVLNERVLHDADESATVGSDGETLHAFVGDAAAGVVSDFRVAEGRELADEELVRKLEGAKAEAVEAEELVDVGAVLIGDEDAEAVVGDADAFRIEAGVTRVSGVLIGVEVVGAPGEIVLEEVVLFRFAGADAETDAGAIGKRGEVEEQGGGFEVGINSVRQAGALVGLEVHFDGVEAIDVADGVVDVGVEGDGVGTAVGHGDELVAGDVGDAGAEASEEVRGGTVFEGAFETGEIGVAAGAASGECAFGDERGLR